MHYTDSSNMFDRLIDIGILNYDYHDGNSNDGSILFKDNFDLDLNIPNGPNNELNSLNSFRNQRYLTFNIPLIDSLSRSNPFVKKAVNYLASKPLVNGIDINIPNQELTSDELSKTQYKIKMLYPSLKETLSKGITYGGSAGLIYIKGDEDFSKPLRLDNVKKDSFMGIKPLSRWFQIEPALDRELISKVGGDTGFDDAMLIGMPMYYNVSFHGALQSEEQSSKFYLVHASRLLIYSGEMPSYIEKRVERFWGISIIESAWEDLVSNKNLWNSTLKSAEKNNMGILKIKGLGLASTLSANAKKTIETRFRAIGQGTSKNIVPIDEQDSFEFATSDLKGQSEVIELSNSRTAGAFNVPPSVFFPNQNGDKEDKSYIQSLATLEDIQKYTIIPWYNKLLPILIKSLFDKEIKDFTITANPIETLTSLEKSEMAKNMSEVYRTLKEIGVLDLSSAMRATDDITKDPANLSQNINKNYRDMIDNKAKNNEFITFNSEKIDVAKALNQLNPKEDENKKGISGVEHPLSSSGGREEGGNPKRNKKII